MEKQLKNLKKRRSSDEQLVEGRMERMEWNWMLQMGE